MSNYTENNTNVFKTVVISSLVVAGIIISSLAAYPKYNVYAQRLDGEAKLAHAQAEKEVAVAEAKAKMESADYLAKAEVIRANGVAKANEIIGHSLKDNESYLRYLWIIDVANNQVGKTVVYVPTEAGLPILESTRIGNSRF